MLNKYINKKVEVAERVYSGIGSTDDSVMRNGKINRVRGVITDVDDKFIELDNNTLIAIQYIYRIKVID